MALCQAALLQKHVWLGKTKTWLLYLTLKML